MYIKFSLSIYLTLLFIPMVLAQEKINNNFNPNKIIVRNIDDSATIPSIPIVEGIEFNVDNISNNDLSKLAIRVFECKVYQLDMQVILNTYKIFFDIFNKIDSLNVPPPTPEIKESYSAYANLIAADIELTNRLITVIETALINRTILNEKQLVTYIKSTIKKYTKITTYNRHINGTNGIFQLNLINYIEYCRSNIMEHVKKIDIKKVEIEIPPILTLIN